MIARMISGCFAIGLGALTCGCTTQDMVQSAARPGKYRYYSCSDLNTHGIALVNRERLLREQIERARQGPGGELAIALAYRTEYATTLSDLQELENTAAEKKCTLKHRMKSDEAVR